MVKEKASFSYIQTRRDFIQMEETNLKKDKNAKEGSFAPLIIFMILAMVLAGLWDKIPIIKNKSSIIVI